MVLRVEQSVYGLKAVAQIRNKLWFKNFQSMRLIKGKADPCVFLIDGPIAICCLHDILDFAGTK